MLNFKHLRYFWQVAKDGSIARASQVLHVTPQTISGQISHFEEVLGVTLFERKGRSLVLTDVGRLVQRYADEIFSLGHELEQQIRSNEFDAVVEFRVGISDIVPKSIATKLLEPALSLPLPIRLICSEGRLDDLLARLSIHKLDLVLADDPIPRGLNVQGYSHLLGQSGLSFFATAELASQLVGEFPECLNDSPMLLPAHSTRMRELLRQWFDKHNIRIQVRGEFDDSALMKAFARTGCGILVAPSAIEQEVTEVYSLKVIGRTEEITDHYYAISLERKISHPAIKSITTAARSWLEVN